MAVAGQRRTDGRVLRVTVKAGKELDSMHKLDLRVILLSIAFLFAGCQPDGLSENTKVVSETNTPVEVSVRDSQPQSTETPTTIASTSQPDSATELIVRFSEFLLQHLEPNQTTYAEVEAILGTPCGEQACNDCDSEGRVFIYEFPFSDELSSDTYTCTLKVEYLTVPDDDTLIAQVRMVPFRGYDSLTIEAFVSHYGVPELVHITVCGRPHSCRIILAYPTLGLDVRTDRVALDLDVFDASLSITNLNRFVPMSTDDYRDRYFEPSSEEVTWESLMEGD